MSDVWKTGTIPEPDEGHNFDCMEPMVGRIVVQPDGGFGIITDVSGALASIDTPAYSYCTAYSKPDSEELLRTAMREHSTEQWFSDVDMGTAFFSTDGTLVVEFTLPGNNMVKLLSEGGDAVDSCDRVLKCLEQMKERITRMQQKVFELSLQQKIER